MPHDTPFLWAFLSPTLAFPTVVYFCSLFQCQKVTACRRFCGFCWSLARSSSLMWSCPGNLPWAGIGFCPILHPGEIPSPCLSYSICATEIQHYLPPVLAMSHKPGGLHYRLVLREAWDHPPVSLSPFHWGLQDLQWVEEVAQELAAFGGPTVL